MWVIRATRRPAVWVRLRPSRTRAQWARLLVPDRRTNRRPTLSVSAALTSTRVTSCCATTTTARCLEHWATCRRSPSISPTRAWKSAGWSRRLRALSEIPSPQSSLQVRWKTSSLSIRACPFITQEVIDIWWTPLQVPSTSRQQEITHCRGLHQLEWYLICFRMSQPLQDLERCYHLHREWFHAVLHIRVPSVIVSPLSIHRHGTAPRPGCAAKTRGVSSTGKTAFERWLVTGMVTGEASA